MARYTPTSTQWYADDHKHSVSVNSSGHWTLWRETVEVDSDFSLPNRPFEKGMTYDEQKAIGYRVLAEHGLQHIKLSDES